MESMGTKGALTAHRGNFEGVETTKLGGCGWIRCARNRVLSHVAQDMVCFWFGAVGGQCAQILGLLRALWGRFATYCGVLGPRGPFGEEKSSCMCRVATISLHLALFSRF